MIIEVILLVAVKEELYSHGGASIEEVVVPIHCCESKEIENNLK